MHHSDASENSQNWSLGMKVQVLAGNANTIESPTNNHETAKKNLNWAVIWSVYQTNIARRMMRTPKMAGNWSGLIAKGR